MEKCYRKGLSFTIKNNKETQTNASVYQCTTCTLTMNFYIVILLHVLMHWHHLQEVIILLC